MATIVLFHHVQGLTPGVQAMAAQLRAAGHAVHTLDLFAGKLPKDLEAGIRMANKLSEDKIQERVDKLFSKLPEELVYIGTSWGAALAQQCAQQRPGAVAAILLESFVGLDAEWSFGPWPENVPVQIHGMDEDPFFAKEGDLEAAQDFAQGEGRELAQLFTYPGNKHLFTDSSLRSHDPEARALVMERMIKFLEPYA
ncbi:MULTISPECIES: dienelactone hydrolase family protein [Glutamicibacter]|uniref:Dienelactone hydrolase n=1 Tax=Glutamicibacter halophytocola TaxID=1933880 RepID=A0A5B8IQ74_9MICC|nr:MULTISPECIES: dienelactone hydrolase family protein [Glutamicibacter]ALG27660.1 dienelactone hydrolase [Glutamicibacter halophytocola]MBF6673516.1 dienelactone hydrolase family protein [Glutamicibacter sp. FBE19]QDY67041.1 dienelactone hydrolase [Glutamicibacter halophytocola]UUX59197.1 dienelactone hydrolase family protein [Glutamicibacter halophytocola]